MEVFPFDIRLAAEKVVCNCFWLKAPLREFILSFGVSERFYDERANGRSKGQFISDIFADLAKHESGEAQILWRIVKALAKLDGPLDDNMDVSTARQSIAKLRGLLDREDSSSQAKSEISLKIEAQKSAFNATADREKRTKEICRAFLNLQNHPDAQERGREFQNLIADLFDAAGIRFERAFKISAQEIDGVFEFLNKHFLVEVRWRRDPADLAQLSSFKSKVDRKLDGTLGLYISVSGFRPDAIQSLLQGSKSNILLLDGMNLIQILEGRIALQDALGKMVHEASKRGNIFIDLLSD